MILRVLCVLPYGGGVVMLAPVSHWRASSAPALTFGLDCHPSWEYAGKSFVRRERRQHA
jgi:hypothetical protein